MGHDAVEPLPQWVEAIAHAIAGSIGGVTAVTVFYPLDILRTRQQVLGKGEAVVKESVVDGLLRIFREEGLQGLYRGLGNSDFCIAVSNLVYFFWYTLLKNLTLKMTQKKVLTVPQNLAIGAVAGSINVITTNPIWVVNTRLKLQSTKINEGVTYKGMLHGLVKIYRDEGIVHGLWRGMGASLILVSNPSINFMVYERIKRIWFKLLGQPGSLGIFTIGAMAKTVATVLTYPVQTVQSRLRAYKAKNQHANLQSVVVQIWQEQGFAGFFRGLTSKMLQTVSAAALMFLVYERIVFWTRKAVAAAWKARLLLTAK